MACCASSAFSEAQLAACCASWMAVSCPLSRTICFCSFDANSFCWSAISLRFCSMLFLFSVTAPESLTPFIRAVLALALAWSAVDWACATSPFMLVTSDRTAETSLRVSAMAALLASISVCATIMACCASSAFIEAQLAACCASWMAVSCPLSRSVCAWLVIGFSVLAGCTGEAAVFSWGVVVR